MKRVIFRSIISNNARFIYKNNKYLNPDTRDSKIK